jgi:Tfp pilus assembly protein PilF
MRTNLNIISIIFLASAIFMGCNKNIVPSAGGLQSIKAYDSTAFDYVFTEALKQKFLGNSGDALKYLEQCIKINPQSDAAYFEMAQIALMLSDLEKGKKFALKAFELNDRNIWYLMLNANIYYQEKKLDSAIIFYEKAVAYFPDKENVKLNLAGIYSEKGEYKKADEIYDYFENKYGINESTALSTVKNLMNSGDYKKAAEKVLKLIEGSPDEILYNGLLAEIYRNSGEIEKAGSVYRKLLEKEPGNPQTLLSLSDFLINEKQYDDLFLILNRVVLSDSVSRADKISLFARVISDSSLIRQRPDDVELSLLVLEADNSGDDIILLLRPELFQNENRLEKAISRLEEIINSRPENYFAWERLLILYSEIKDWDNLFVKGRECATKFNRSFLAKILFANAALEKSEFTVAEEELKKAKILAGNDSVLQVQVLVMDADLFYRKKEFAKSFEIFREALKIKPGDIMVLNNYAYYLAEQGENLREAERMAKMVIEKEKGNSTYLDTYAWILYKRGRYKEAQRIMEAIMSMGEPKNAEWYDHLGYISKALGKCDKAVDYWKEAIRLDNRKTLLLKEIESCVKR